MSAHCAVRINISVALLLSPGCGLAPYKTVERWWNLEVEEAIRSALGGWDEMSKEDGSNGSVKCKRSLFCLKDAII